MGSYQRPVRSPQQAVVLQIRSTGPHGASPLCRRKMTSGPAGRSTRHWGRWPALVIPKHGASTRHGWPGLTVAASYCPRGAPGGGISGAGWLISAPSAPLRALSDTRTRSSILTSETVPGVARADHVGASGASPISVRTSQLDSARWAATQAGPRLILGSATFRGRSWLQGQAWVGSAAGASGSAPPDSESAPCRGRTSLDCRCHLPHPWATLLLPPPPRCQQIR